MKKTLLIVAVASLAMASCRKDRTCTCTETSDQPGFVAQTRVETYKESKKKDATNACLSYTSKQTLPVASQYYYGENCELN